jgi:Asp-tRNA(Asn)/Glu-tRNA(Gln) amidotransferase A subunit family amidase
MKLRSRIWSGDNNSRCSFDASQSRGCETGSNPLRLDAVALANRELPALTVPAGFSETGLPIGIDLFGWPLQERVLFQIARAYKAGHDWSRRMPEFRQPKVTAR